MRIAAAALAAAVFAGPALPAPPAPASSSPTRADLDAAVAKGVKFLLSDQKPDGGWISREYSMSSSGHATAITSVAMEAVLAGAGPTPEAMKAIHAGLEFLGRNAPGILEGKTHDGFDFNGWGAAYGLRHLAGLRDRWPAGTKAPDWKPLVDGFVAWARKYRHPCGAWSYLTKAQDPRFEKDGSVSFLTGVMIEGLARWDPASPLLGPAAEDLAKSCNDEGRVLYERAGNAPPLPPGAEKEQAAGRSLQAALVLAGLGKREPADVEKRLAEFLEVRGEYAKVRREHGHMPPHRIAGYYYYHAHSHAARALRFLAAKEGAPSKSRDARVATLLGALLEEQDPDGSWMDAPCGDRPYATALAVLELLDLRELLFPWTATLEAAVAAAKEAGAPVVAFFTDGSPECRKAEEMLASKDLDPVREKVRWVRIGKEAADAWKAARVSKGPVILVLGPLGEYEAGRPTQKWGGGVSAKVVRSAIEKMLPK